MENWINLDNLPRRKDGKISWKDCDHNLVEFCYRNNHDSFYIENRIDVDSVQIKYHDNLIKLDIQSIQKCCLGKLFNFAVKDNYIYKEHDILNKGKQNLVILDCIRISYSNGKSSKGYKVQCLDCNNIFDISEANLFRGDGCNSCSNHKVVIGRNDLWTTRPDVAAMLKYPQYGYKLMQFSNKAEEFVCPRCGKDIGTSYIHNVSRFGLSCPFCGDGISYPNKLMQNLLSMLNIDFHPEVVFNWCVFPDYQDKTKLSYGRYDFVIDSEKIIIEMDGGLGHGNNPHPNSRYTKEELIYRDQMKDYLADKNGYLLFRIDCNYSSHNRLDYCSKNIMNSGLAKLFDLSEIDWDLLNKLCV